MQWLSFKAPNHNTFLSVSALFKIHFIGDQIAGMLAVAVASSRTLEVLDLEGTGLTNQSAQVNNTFKNATVLYCTVYIQNLMEFRNVTHLTYHNDCIQH